MDWEGKFAKEFKCPKCGHEGARTKKLAMSGTGLSKLLDVQMNKYLFVSCSTCGFTEVYNLKVLEGKGDGMDGMDLLDLFFGG